MKAKRLLRRMVPVATSGAAEGWGGDGDPLEIAGVALVADFAGALYWPQERLLAVADLHLEKGSSFAVRGALIPPYDTADTLARLEWLLVRYAPRIVVGLGDNFHDRKGSKRLAAADRATLAELQRGREWIWIAGNHDPDPAGDVDGTFAASLGLGPLTFRHEASAEGLAGEIAGHLHPVACVATRARAVRRRCFVSDGQRLVMPAFGAYTGGLNVRHRAFAAVFADHAFMAHVLGESRLYAIHASRCLPD
jgi:DNA ligase-associated metallophosphoesterase